MATIKEPKRHIWEMTKDEFLYLPLWSHKMGMSYPDFYDDYKAIGWPEGYQYNKEFGYADKTGYHGMLKSALSHGKSVPDAVLKDYPDLRPKEYDMDKGQLIKEIMTYVPKDSDKYESTEKSLGTLHTYELRDSLLALKREHLEQEGEPVSVDENAAIHAYYDANPDKDKLRKRKTKKRPARRSGQSTTIGRMK